MIDIISSKTNEVEKKRKHQQKFATCTRGNMKVSTDGLCTAIKSNIY